jgi:hypothetical protein
MKKPLLLAFRRGPTRSFSSPAFFYPVGPLVSGVSDSSAHAKKALDGFKAFEVSVSARERFTSIGCVRV